MSTDLYQIGKLINEERIKKGLSVEQLAESAGVSGRAITYWEKGEKMPTIISVDKILKVLGVELKLGKQNTITAS